jgi:hypothetical protein
MNRNRVLVAAAIAAATSTHLVAANGKSVELTLGTGKFSGIRGGGEYTVAPLPPIAGSRNSCPEAKWKFTLPD